MKRWQLKCLLANTFGRTAPTTAFYRFLTNQILASQKRAPWKWCQWFREHALLCKRHAGIDAHHANLWLFDPGWTIAPGLLAYLATSGQIIATDNTPRIRSRYNHVSVETVLNDPVALGKGYSPPSERLEVARTLASGSARRAFERMGIPYFAPAGKAFPELEYRDTMDICLSMGVLEHYTPEALEDKLDMMNRILRPGGAASHIIDHRNHYWHADYSISPFEHLYYSEKKWRRLANNRLFYCNRLVQSDFVALFEKHGFEIVYLGSKPYPDYSPELDRERLQGRYRELSDQDLFATVSHIIAVKK